MKMTQDDSSSSSSSWINLGIATLGSASGRHLRDFVDIGGVVIVIVALAGEENE